MAKLLLRRFWVRNHLLSANIQAKHNAQEKKIIACKALNEMYASIRL